MSHFPSEVFLKHEKIKNKKMGARAVNLKSLPLISDLSHSSKAAWITAKMPFKIFFFLKVTQFDLSLHNLEPDVSGSCSFAQADVWPGDLDGEYSRLRPCGEFQGGSLSWPSYDPSCAAHMGKLPHHTVKMLPDGLRILLLPDSVVLG